MDLSPGSDLAPHQVSEYIERRGRPHVVKRFNYLTASHLHPCTTHQVASAPQGQGDTEATLSRDEKLRRERQRAYAVGVTAYAWAGPRRLLIPMQGSLFVQEGTPAPTSASASASAAVPAAPLRLAYDAKASRYGASAFGFC